jgi:hypothetical protein
MTAQTIDTRIGKIELRDGYSSRASAEKLFDEMDFQRATQAFIWALPAVGFHSLHLAQRDTFGAKDGEVVLYQTLKDKEGNAHPEPDDTLVDDVLESRQARTSRGGGAGRGNRRRVSRHLATADFGHWADGA